MVEKNQRENNNREGELDVNEEIKKIVLTRLKSMPHQMRVSIGGKGGLGKRELIKHVENEDELGKLIIKAHIENLRSFKKAANRES